MKIGLMVLTFWDDNTNKKLINLMGYQSFIKEVLIQNNGETILIGANNILELRDVETDKKLKKFFSSRQFSNP
jgi:hypothetical protein